MLKGGSEQRLQSELQALAGSRSRQWAQGDDDDDHDACDDEFSSCGQLDPRAKEREKGGGGRRGDFIEEEWKNGP